MSDSDQGGEWVTGVIGAPFRVDAQGNPIPGSEEQDPTELPDSSEILKAFEEAGKGGGVGDLMPTGILPNEPQMIGGNDDETQKDIWDKMDRGELGSGGDSLPPDVETAL